MLSTMQDHPLTITDLFSHGRTVHADSTVATFEGDRTRHATFAAVAERAERLAAALTRLGITADRARRDLQLEHAGAPRDLLRGAGDGRRAAHAQHPALPRAARLHREPRRGPRRDRRGLARAAARQGARSTEDRAST